jgi:hypothetical protein
VTSSLLAGMCFGMTGRAKARLGSPLYRLRNGCGIRSHSLQCRRQVTEIPRFVVGANTPGKRLACVNAPKSVPVIAMLPMFKEV